MTVSQPVYQLDNIVHRYNGQPVLNIDHLDIQPSSIVGLVGPNGSGKSTLLKIMGFIQKPTEGQILFNGKPAVPFDEAVRFQVTLLTQEPCLMKRPVFKNVAYGLNVRGDNKNQEKLVCDALAMVGLDPNTFYRRPWDQLSGGEAQRVALAARLVLKPKVLLLDEPTANVDAASSELIRSESIRARSDWGATIVIASHDRQWLYDVCDEVLHLFKGKPAGSGRSNMIFGPWVQKGDGCYAKRIGDGTVLIVPPPPNEDATAFMDPASIRIVPANEKTTGKDMASVEGKIIRLSLDQPSGHLFADVRIGSLTLVVCVEESHLVTTTLHRGWPVTLTYRLDSVSWL